MNRLIIIGNGFDLAHGLKTSYKDFIEWYWEQRLNEMLMENDIVSKDCLCEIKLENQRNFPSLAFMLRAYKLRNVITCEWLYPSLEIISFLEHETESLSLAMTPFMENICNNVQSKGWVNIEKDYYSYLCNIGNPTIDLNYDEPKILNEELNFIKAKLIEYLTEVQNSEYSKCDKIKKQIFSPISAREIAISRLAEFSAWQDSLYLIPSNYWKGFANIYNTCWNEEIKDLEAFRTAYDSGSDDDVATRRQGIPEALQVPTNIMVLNFNYTNVADRYMPENDHFPVVHIHGKLDDKDSVIFGYGDELDDEYRALETKEDNEYLRNVKSVHYLESTSYRQMLDFIESDLYQVYIMGHSCGNSDRTLLNTLFEHPNCVSVKPYYYKKDDTHDNYLEMVQNITRNFNDKKLMRDRVVNKEFCEPLG